MEGEKASQIDVRVLIWVVVKLWFWGGFHVLSNECPASISSESILRLLYPLRSFWCGAMWVAAGHELKNLCAAVTPSCEEDSGYGVSSQFILETLKYYMHD